MYASWPSCHPLGLYLYLLCRGICIACALPPTLSAGQLRLLFLAIFGVNLQQSLRSKSRDSTNCLRVGHANPTINMLSYPFACPWARKRVSERGSARERERQQQRPQRASLWLLLLHFELAICFDFCSLITFFYASICSLLLLLL